MTDYKTYLAANVLNDGKNVTYRLLSRELKVHANIAKQMLYEFHSSQNKKKPRSVVATYLVTGYMKAANDQAQTQPAEGEDSHMQSSPFMSSSMPQHGEGELLVAMKSVVLASEENLEELCRRFERIESAHIYSLNPSVIKNLEILSECNRIVSQQFIKEDPLMHGKTYGVIQNFAVRRRKGTRPPNIGAPLAVATTAIPPKPVKSSKEGVAKAETSVNSQSGQPSSKDSITSEAKPSQSSQQSIKTESKGPTKQPAAKRGKTDIFKAFAKPKPRLESQDTASSVDSAPPQEPTTAQHDDAMKDASEDEQPDDFVEPSKTSSKGQKSRSQREEALRKMMDEEDEDMEDAPPLDPETAEESQNSEIIDEPVSKPEETSPEPPVTVSGGRRRGRRKVMKKKTIKDEEGYLVTKDEPVWESFSEDEPAPSKEKTPFSSMASTKSKQGSGKPGQGNITSFFGKR